MLAGETHTCSALFSSAGCHALAQAESVVTTLSSVAIALMLLPLLVLFVADFATYTARLHHAQNILLRHGGGGAHLRRNRLEVQVPQRRQGPLQEPRAFSGPRVTQALLAEAVGGHRGSRMRLAQDCLPATPPAPDAIRPALSPLVSCGRRALRGLRDSKARPGPALAARLPRGCSLFMDPVANYLWAQ